MQTGDIPVAVLWYRSLTPHTEPTYSLCPLKGRLFVSATIHQSCINSGLHLSMPSIFLVVGVGFAVLGYLLKVRITKINLTYVTD